MSSRAPTCATARWKASSPPYDEDHMKHQPRILVVEDEPAIAELIAVNLRHNGLSPVWASDGEAAQREIDAVLPDAILLDWMLPGQPGVVLARRWRADARTRAVPILM